MVSCPDCIKDGKQYGWSDGNFLEQWDDHYQCALSYIDGQCYENALKSLDKAIQKRDGDQWQARSYGMHFVNYFPHREKGVCYFETGRYELARQELLYSLSKEPSAKARYYLDQTRKFLLSDEPVSSPEIVIHHPTLVSQKTDKLITKHYPVMLLGTVLDHQYIADIHICEIPFFMDKTKQKVNIKKPLFLAEGNHNITISARNLMGGMKETNIVLSVDLSGPVITLSSVQSGISGYVYDTS